VRASIKVSKSTDTLILAFNNQQMLQAMMECRGGLAMEEWGMMTTMVSTNVPFGRVSKGDDN
jgi:hypothetical protein